LRCGIYLLVFTSASLAFATLALWARGYWRADYFSADWWRAIRGAVAEDDREESWLIGLESARGRISLTSDFMSKPWGAGWCGVGGPPGPPVQKDFEGEFSWRRGARELSPYDGHWPGTTLRRFGFGEQNTAHFFDRDASRRFAMIMVPHWVFVLGMSILPAVSVRSWRRKRQRRGFQVETRRACIGEPVAVDG
jgi:hypothetical protein